MAWSRARSRSTGCALLRGQPCSVTVPPVTSAAAKKGAAPDRSGSMSQARPVNRPGSTTQTSGVPSSTAAPAARSISTVIRRCGALGTGGPQWRTTIPRSNRGAASSSPETNWLDADASMTISPPRTAPDPCTVSGRPPPAAVSISTPIVRSPSISGPSGRTRACGSPSKVISPVASAATGGRNRMTVPASPTSTCAGPRIASGRTTQRSPWWVETCAPMARRPAAISSVSRARNGPRSVDGPAAMALSTSARAVMDLEPGRRTVVLTGAFAVGAVQGTGVRVAARGGTANSLPRHRDQG
jgi:hypothetical protein